MKRFVGGFLVALMPLLSLPLQVHASQTGAIVLTSVTPTVPRATDTIVLTGTVANDTASPWRNAQIDIRIGQSPFSGRLQLNDWLQGRARDTRSVRVFNVGTLAASAVKSWSVAIPARNLGLSTRAAAQGVYPLTAVASNGATSTRTFLVWAPNRNAVKASPLVMMVPLTWQPARIASGRFQNSSLLTDVSVNGRLTKLLDAGMNSDVTWLIDPSLIEALVDLADGAQVLENGAYRDVLSQEQQRAQLWLNRAKTILTSRNTYVFPAGNADLVAMAATGEADSIASLVQRGQQIIARDLSVVAAGTVALANAGLTEDIRQQLVQAGVAVVVTTSKAYPASTSSSFTPSSVLNDIAVSDSDIDALISSGALANDIIAMTSMVAFERPQQARSVVLSAPLTGDPVNIAAIVSAMADSRTGATVRLQPLAQMSPAQNVGRSLADFPVSPELLVNQKQLRIVQSLQQRANVLSSLATTELDKSIVGNSLSSAIDPSRSVVWAQDPTQGSLFVSEQDAYVSSLESSIEISTATRVMLSGNRGVIPVTVRNGLSWPINIQLSASSQSNVRASLTDAPAIMTIAPGERASVELRVRVVGTTRVPMVIRALTSEGQAVGQPVRVEVGSAAYARVASYVVLGAFVLLSLLVLRTTIRRIKRKVT